MNSATGELIEDCRSVKGSAKMKKTETRERSVVKRSARESSLSATIYGNVKKRIINGEFVPGSILLERTLSEEFGVSRTPVREALKRLSQEGWIDWQERRRAVVSEITEEKILELFKVREMIEPFAIAEAVDSGRSQLLAGQLAAVNIKMAAAGSPIDFMKYDMEFHTTIVNSIDISLLASLWQKVKEDMTRLAMHSIYPQRDHEIILGEHNALMDALWRSERENALECIKNHFSITVDYFRKKHESQHNSQA